MGKLQWDEVSSRIDGPVLYDVKYVVIYRLSSNTVKVP